MRMIGIYSSRQFFEFCAEAVHGVACPKSSRNGTAHPCTLPFGVTATFGSESPTCWVAMPAWNTCSLTPPLFTPTSVPMATKKSWQSENRPLARWPDNNTSSSHRRAEQFATCHSLGRENRQYRPCLCHEGVSTEASRGSRQGHDADRFLTKIEAVNRPDPILAHRENSISMPATPAI
jgi:hypothetical protein